MMSPVFRRLLCPLDFGPVSAQCLDFARQLAGAESKVILFHAVPMPIEALGQPIYIEPMAGAEHDARERLKKLAAHATLKDVEIAAVTGEPASEIIRAALDHKCDLIVIATHGRAGVGHFFLGSVTERVIRESPIPVLSIRERHKGHAIAAGSILI
jgi:nucleotide-binding universal stress UspA family protein